MDIRRYLTKLGPATSNPNPTGQQGAVSWDEIAMALARVQNLLGLLLLRVKYAGFHQDRDNLETILLKNTQIQIWKTSTTRRLAKLVVDVALGKEHNPASHIRSLRISRSSWYKTWQQRFDYMNDCLAIAEHEALRDMKNGFEEDDGARGSAR